MMSSPAQFEKVGKNWDAFAKTPSGTGPWKLTAFLPRERAEMVRTRPIGTRRACPSSTSWW